MRIQVTQRDIEVGVQGNCFHCPVARAVRRALRAREVWVREIIIVTKSGSRDNLCDATSRLRLHRTI